MKQLKHIVYCTTQEEWDAVVDWTEMDDSRSFKDYFADYNCIRFYPAKSVGYYAFDNRDFYLKHPELGEIISFKEFKKTYMLQDALNSIMTPITDKELIAKIEQVRDSVDSIKEFDNAKQVGDINSSAKGSGARYNNGKPDYSLILLDDLAEVLPDGVIKYMMRYLGLFQKTGNVMYLNDALYALDKKYISESAYVFTYGAEKYAAWNWTKGMKWSIPLACAARHLMAKLSGEEYDTESGYDHLGHFVCNVFMLIHYHQNYKEGNDLPSPEYFNVE